jgi:hypothetical protein
MDQIRTDLYDFILMSQYDLNPTCEYKLSTLIICHNCIKKRESTKDRTPRFKKYQGFLSLSVRRME